jgi:hypothetical protein
MSIIHPEPMDVEQLRIASMPYARRKLVVIADDAIVRAERLAAKEAHEGKTVPDSSDINWRELAVSWLKSMVMPGYSAMMLAQAAIEIYNNINKLRATGVDVLTITISEAEQLIFAPGHPLNKVVYVAHPASSSIYYTAAQFHRLTFEHKFSEAIRLLMALGATEMEVEHVSGWSREFSARLSVPLATAGVSAGADAGKEESRGSYALYTAKLNPRGEATRPDGMVWFPHEPTWHRWLRADWTTASRISPL